jgi:DNA-binding MarR family transcriptional regulator
MYLYLLFYYYSVFSFIFTYMLLLPNKRQESELAIKAKEPKLNDKQLLTLKLAYKFRYLTTDNLARRRKISQNAAYSSLNILHKRGYLGRKHNKSYRLQNKSARYHLTLKTVKLLSQPEHEMNKDVLLTRRFEDKKSPEFIDLQVAIMTAYLDIKDSVDDPDSLIILNASEMAERERDNYLRSYPSLEIYDKDTSHHYLIEVFPDNQHLFLLKKRVRQYIDHYDNQPWEWKQYPDVYFVRKSLGDRRRLKAYIEEKMDDSFIDEDEFEMFAIKEAKEWML